MLNEVDFLQQSVRDFLRREANSLGFELSWKKALIDSGINILISAALGLITRELGFDPTPAFIGAMLGTTVGCLKSAIPKAGRYEVVKHFSQ